MNRLRWVVLLVGMVGIAACDSIAYDPTNRVDYGTPSYSEQTGSGSTVFDIYHNNYY